MKTSRYATRLLQPTVLLDNLTGLQSTEHFVPNKDYCVRRHLASVGLTQSKLSVLVAGHTRVKPISLYTFDMIAIIICPKYSA